MHQIFITSVIETESFGRIKQTLNKIERKKMLCPNLTRNFSWLFLVPFQDMQTTRKVLHLDFKIQNTFSVICQENL